MDRKGVFSKAKRIVVKLGTASITEKLALDDQKVRKIVSEISNLKKSGKDVIVVSSGAIACGISKLSLRQRPRDMNMLQACAAVGQNELMRAYGREFERQGFVVAQVLLTRQDFESRARYLNIRNTFNTLLKLGVVPIVNENDSVSVDEIKFGDNDTLSTLIASNLDADILILMSSMDGLYTMDPRKSKDAERISVVEKVTDDIDGLDGKSWGGGVGGIQSKIRAGKTMMKCGIPMAIVDGKMKDVLSRLIGGEPVGTVFLPGKRLDNRLQFVLLSTKTDGTIVVDDGASATLRKGRTSLLPPGVVDVKGRFRKGDAVSVSDLMGVEFARGISNYGSEEVALIKGRKCADIESILGRKSCKEIIYHDNMILLGK